jgi:hypothetical protein
MSVQYFDNKPYKEHYILSPKWSDVEKAITQMDDYYYPYIQLSDIEEKELIYEDNNVLTIFGGNNRYALLNANDSWKYEDPKGEDTEVRLWKSDQGFFCKEKHIASLKKTIELANLFYNTASYEELREKQ